MKHPGALIVIAGPDGAGKTTLATELLERLGDRQTMHLHHRPGALPRIAGGESTSTPHAAEPYPVILSTAKVLYLFLDHWLAWLLRLRWFVRKGGIVVLERGWWDLVVDPRRYRLAGVEGLSAALARVLPGIGATAVLTASPEVLVDRKSELSAMEIERQLARWSAIGERDRRVVLLDAIEPPSSNVDRLLESLGADPARRDWVGLPSARSPRWIVPRTPARAAVAGLGIYQPVTTRALLGWHAARVLARMGAFRLLPGSVALPDRLRDAIAEHLPPGGTVSVATTRRASRYVVLLMDASGEPVGIAKLAFDPAGREDLAHEARSIERYAGLLPRPLSAPTVAASSGSALLLEAADSRPRLRPWRLPLDVAHALGEAFRAGRRGTGSGFAHGDFAPWNLLWTDDGWTLVDWEHSGEDAPFTDVFHYFVQAHALLGHPSARALIEGVRGGGYVGRCIRAYARGAGLSMEDAASGFVAYLERSRERFEPAERDGMRSIAARNALLARLRGPGFITDEQLGNAPRRIAAFAYSCTPGVGSEPGAGWIGARLVATFGETWVFTRPTRARLPAIEQELATIPEAGRLHIVYVHLPRWLRRFDRGIDQPRLERTEYLVWQIQALRVARRMHKRRPFDLAWHLTWANVWLGSLACVIGAPFVYGPVGGGVTPPWGLVSTTGARGVFFEIIRASMRGAARWANPLARMSWRRASLILCQNAETMAWLPAAQRAKARIFTNTILEEPIEPRRDHRPAGPPTALFAGRLLPLKGVALALLTMRHLPDWRLIVCGQGPDEARLRRIAVRLQLGDRVEFRGWVERPEVLRTMREEANVFLFPSLHEEGGWAVVEAIASGLPVVCLDRGGPPVFGGIAVRATTPRATAKRLAAAVRASGDAPSVPSPDLETRRRDLEELLATFEPVATTEAAR